MHWTLFAFAGTALIGAHVLRLPSKSGLMGGIMAFLAGLVVAALAIKLIAGALGIGRTTELDAFVNHAVAVAEQTDDPLIIFSGASFSRNAIDDERLTLALNERGHPHRVVSLSLEAASLTERQAHIKQFLDRSPRAPDVVFIEVSELTDNRPTFIFGNSKFSTRAIEQFGADETLWAATGLIGGGCNGAVDCVKQAGFLGIHSLLNAINIGLIAKGEPVDTVKPERAYDAVFEAREQIDPVWRTQELIAPTNAQPAQALKWAQDFRRLERDMLTEAGASKIAYYFPPVIPSTSRNYVAGLCQSELSDFICLAPTDPALRKALDGDVWLDRDHLLDPGTAIYTNWLADQIIATGALDAPEVSE